MPRPRFKLTPRERERVMSEYVELEGPAAGRPAKIPRHPATSLILAACVIVPIVSLKVTDAFASLQNAAGCFINVAVLGTAAVVAVCVAFGTNTPQRRKWRTAMRRCGHDVCVMCGYRLDGRAAASIVCPECGTPDAEQPVPVGHRSSGAESSCDPGAPSPP